MGRPRKIKAVETQTVNETIPETKQEEVKPIIENKNEVVLVKIQNRYLVASLITLDKKVNIKHISGSGMTNDPKNWFVEVMIGTLDKLSSEDQDQIQPASYKEIEERIENSKKVKIREQIENGAQKRKPGEQPRASAHY